MKLHPVASALLLATTLVAVGCGEKESGPVKVDGYETYTDPYFNFSIGHPKSWPKGISSGVAVYYSANGIDKAFNEFDPGDQTGAKIEVRSMLGGSAAQTSSVDELRSIFQDPSVLKGPQQVQLNGESATLYTYEFPEVNFKAERYYVVKDTVVTYLETAVFGDWNRYAAVFDSSKAAFKPGQIAIAQSPSDTTGGATTGTPTELVSPPAAEMKSYSGSHFTISYPANFNATTSSGGKLASQRFIGDRVDSYYQVDVNQSSADLDAHAGAVKGLGSPRSTTVGGQSARVFSYSGGKNVSSRLYLVKSGDKLYQITVNWFQPQNELYLPVFEKALASFKAK